MNRPLSNSNQWFVRLQTEAKAETRLFLFPYAGGSPATFGRWAVDLPNTVEVWTAHYPGRGSRYNEPPIKELNTMVENLYQAIQSLLDKPFVFFGHSLGGLIAFELARKLHQQNLPLPQILFVSACAAPQLLNLHPPFHTLPKDEFIKSLRELNGFPDEVLNNAELMELILPSLRADFEIIGNYQHTSNDRLPSPIIAFGGLEDPRVSRELLEGWASHTNNFKSQYFPGDHFFINIARKPVIDFITDEISSHEKR